MPLDGSSAKQDIDNNLGNKGYRGIRIANVITALKNNVDWVVTSINNNLTTWLKVADGQPGGANTDAVYRIGKAIFGRNASNGTAAALEATQAWIDNLNGNKVSPWFTITQPGDNLGAQQYYSICELPATSGGSYDFAQIEFVGKSWDNTISSPIELSLYVANRGAFVYQYTSRGDGSQNGSGLVAMKQADGRVIIYMFADNSFKAISARVVHQTQVTVYNTPGFSTTVSGTEVFHSGKPTQYRPLLAVRSRFTAITIGNSDGAWPVAPISEAGSAQISFGANWIGGSSDVTLLNSNFAGSGFSFWQQTGSTARRFLAWITGGGDMILGGTGTQPAEKLHVVGNAQVDGYIRTGSGNSAFKITGVKSASNLTLKTSRYLELTLSDGTLVKVAEVS